ncbi:MAG: hypothetical protein AB3N22_14260 [Ruegeria sp.]
MTDTPLSEATMLASLRDIQLPAEAAGGLGAELAVAMGGAGLCALGVVALLRLLSRRRVLQTKTLGDALAALSDASDPERRVALLHLLRAHAPARYAALKADLYRPEGGPDIAALEAEVARLV